MSLPLRLVLVSAVMLAACDGPAEPDGSTAPPPTCTDPDPVALPADRAVIEASDRPYRIDADLVVDSMVVRPGATLCFALGVRLDVRSYLDVQGTAERPVTFAGAEGQPGWSGVVGRLDRSTASIIVAAATVRMSHAVVRDGENGVVSADATLEDVRVESTGGAGLAVAGELRRVVVEEACGLAGPPTPPFGAGCAALILVGNGGGDPTEAALTDVEIRSSGGDGLSISSSVHATLADVRIRGTAGTGVRIVPRDARATLPDVVVDGALSLSDVQGYLLDGWAAMMVRVLDALDVGLRAGDSVRTMGAIVDRPVAVPPDVLWVAEPLGVMNQSAEFPRGVTLGPGSRLRFDLGRGNVVAAGTADAPALLEGRYWAADTLWLEHARIDLRGTFPGTVHTGTDGLVRWTDVRVRGGELRLRGRSVTLERVLVDSSRVLVSAPASLRTVLVRGAPDHGVEIDADSVRIDGCSVTDSRLNGFQVRGAGTVITGCNIVGNAGLGVFNAGTDLVRARANWWGDPAGPSGPAGAGVSGAVDASLPLPGPVELAFPSARASAAKR